MKIIKTSSYKKMAQFDNLCDICGNKLDNKDEKLCRECKEKQNNCEKEHNRQYLSNYI